MLNLINLEVGQSLKLRNGSVGEIVDNIGDGIWVTLKFTGAVPGSPAVGEEELVHCEEIVDLAD
jgi:hypothetical protein